MGHIKKLTLLHSNDLHGDFLAEQKEKDFVGGLSLLSGYLNSVREAEKNVLYAIAGDMFRGSIIDSEFKGISTVEMVNLLEPDIVTIGNHEVDYGIAHLLFIEKCAIFPIINANLYIKTNRTNLFTPFKILNVDGMKILFIGIITEEVLSQTKQDSLIGSFIDTAQAADEVGRICNAYNSIDIDFTVLLTHIGIEKDLELARLLNPAWGVDIIIGGHSHTVLDQPLQENGVVIAHAGHGTDNIGRFDIQIDTDNNCIDSYTWEFVPINHRTSPRDEQMESVLQKYKGVTDEKYRRVVTRLKKALTHPNRNEETALGNLFADALQESLGVDIMLLGSGSIRAQTLGPIVDFGVLVETFPYDDGIYMLKVTGAMLRRMLKHMLRDEAFLGVTEFYQLSNGVKLTYSRSKRDFLTLQFRGAEIQDEQVFTIGLQQFHYMNLEEFLDLSPVQVEKLQKPRVISTSCHDILEQYLKSHRRLSRSVEGRIAVTA